MHMVRRFSRLFWVAVAAVIVSGTASVAGDAGAGDIDGDGDVDLSDLSALVQCLTGPGGGILLDCDNADVDVDEDVDLRDFVFLQVGFTGPGPFGDIDGDEDVDLDDLSALVQCLAGPGEETPPGCEDADFDSNGSVDLRDYGRFQIGFTGSWQACCFTDGTCEDFTALACNEAAGEPQGDETDCGSVTCPQPDEACHLDDCECQDLPPDECTAQGGAPQGPGTDCNTNGFVLPDCTITAPDFAPENTSGLIASVPAASGGNVEYDWSTDGPGQITSTPPFSNQVEFETFDVEGMDLLFIYVTVTDWDTGCSCDNFHRVIVTE